MNPEDKPFLLRRFVLWFARWPLFIRLVPLLLLILIICVYLYDRSQAFASFDFQKLPVLPLEGVKRLMIIAPHPDDETLCCGGVIQVAKSMGVEIKVVVVTNGDGQPLAPIAFDRRFDPRAVDYISLGERRQAEALSALEQLGVTAQDITFLGYPDRGLLPLWINDWHTGCPIRSWFTRATHSPYPLTYNPSAVYCGKNLFDDLYALMVREHPDVIFIPHPNDEHPDHRATSNFVQMALAMERERDSLYQPVVWGYVIHYGLYPQPKGKHLNKALLPPSPLAGRPDRLARLDLTPAEVTTKMEAIQQYATQLRLLGDFLPSFARGNEIFFSLQPLELPLVGYEFFPLLETDVETIPLTEPTRESARRVLLPGADLTGWKIARLGDTLLLTADTRGRLLPGLTYRIVLKTPQGKTYTYSLKDAQMSRYFSSFTAQVNLPDLDNPAVLGIAAEVRQGVVLDRTGWSFLILRDPLEELFGEGEP